MLKILGDLAEDDYFGLITFDSHVSTWRKELVPASQDNLSAAKQFAGAIQERGGEQTTNFSSVPHFCARPVEGNPIDPLVMVCDIITVSPLSYGHQCCRVERGGATERTDSWRLRLSPHTAH